MRLERIAEATGVSVFRLLPLLKGLQEVAGLVKKENVIKKSALFRRFHLC